MLHVWRGWVAFASIGAGILHLALVVDAALPLAVPLILIGAAECGWAVFVLAKNRYVAAEVARFAYLLPLLLWLGALLPSAAGADAGSAALPFIPMAVATLFDLVISVSLCIATRCRRTETTRALPPAGRYVLGLFAGGLIVSMLMTPALGFTAAGRDAHSHPGSVELPADVGHH